MLLIALHRTGKNHFAICNIFAIDITTFIKVSWNLPKNELFGYSLYPVYRSLTCLFGSICIFVSALCSYYCMQQKFPLPSVKCILILNWWSCHKGQQTQSSVDKCPAFGQHVLYGIQNIFIQQKANVFCWPMFIFIVLVSHTPHCPRPSQTARMKTVMMSSACALRANAKTEVKNFRLLL